MNFCFYHLIFIFLAVGTVFDASAITAGARNAMLSTKKDIQSHITAFSTVRGQGNDALRAWYQKFDKLLADLGTTDRVATEQYKASVPPSPFVGTAVPGTSVAATSVATTSVAKPAAPVTSATWPTYSSPLPLSSSQPQLFQSTEVAKNPQSPFEISHESPFEVEAPQPEQLTEFEIPESNWSSPQLFQHFTPEPTQLLPQQKIVPVLEPEPEELPQAAFNPQGPDIMPYPKPKPAPSLSLSSSSTPVPVVQKPVSSSGFDPYAVDVYIEPYKEDAPPVQQLPKTGPLTEEEKKALENLEKAKAAIATLKESKDIKDIDGVNLKIAIQEKKQTFKYPQCSNWLKTLAAIEADLAEAAKSKSIDRNELHAVKTQIDELEKKVLSYAGRQVIRVSEVLKNMLIQPNGSMDAILKEVKPGGYFTKADTSVAEKQSYEFFWGAGVERTTWITSKKESPWFKNLKRDTIKKLIENGILKSFSIFNTFKDEIDLLSYSLDSVKKALTEIQKIIEEHKKLLLEVVKGMEAHQNKVNISAEGYKKINDEIKAEFDKKDGYLQKIDTYDKEIKEQLKKL